MRLTRYTLVACLLLCATAPASADTIAVIGLEAQRDSGPTRQDAQEAAKITKRLRALVRDGALSGHTLAKRGNRDLVELRLLYDCSFVDSDCLAKIGTTLRARFLVYGSIRMDKDKQASIFLFDVSQKKYVRSLQESLASDISSSDAQALLLELFGAPDVGSIALRVSSAPPGTVVIVDGSDTHAFHGKTLFLNNIPTGSHTIKVQAPDGRQFTKAIEVNGNKTTMLDSSFASKDKRRTSKILFWSSVAVLGASATGLTITGSQVRGYETDKRDALQSLANQGIFLDQQDACSDAKSRKASSSKAEYGQIASACSKGQTSATLSNVFIGTSVAAAAAAGYFLYRGYLSDEKLPSAAEPTVRVVPQVSPDSVGAGLSIEF